MNLKSDRPRNSWVLQAAGRVSGAVLLTAILLHMVSFTHNQTLAQSIGKGQPRSAQIVNPSNAKPITFVQRVSIRSLDKYSIYPYPQHAAAFPLQTNMNVSEPLPRPVGYKGYTANQGGITVGTETTRADDPQAYDPSLTLHQSRIVDLEITDNERKRTLPIRWYLPTDAREPWPVIVLSHGLGGSRQGCKYLGKHWSSRGYFVIALQHPGSDESVWKGQPRMKIMANMKRAASGENLKLRAEDVTFALNELESWNRDSKHQLFKKLDLKHIGMAGHSFGAVTTQAVAGQKYRGKPAFEDRRITAALPLSPSPPRMGDPKMAFGDIKMPWLSMTGTLDEAPIGGITAKQRPEVYQALPAGDKYELILEGAKHHAFGDENSRGKAMPRNPKHHPAILAISTAFWDSYLRENQQAEQWLGGDEPRAWLESKDQWRKK